MYAILEPIYVCEQGANSVHLGDGPVEIEHNGHAIKGVGQARLQLQPRFILTIQTDFSQSNFVQAHAALNHGVAIDFKYGALFERSRALAGQ
jgi:hypothetical protein